MQSHRVAVVLLHELFDGEQMGRIAEPELLRQPDLFVERENLLRHSRMDVEKRPHAQEKLPRVTQRVA